MTNEMRRVGGSKQDADEGERDQRGNEKAVG